MAGQELVETEVMAAAVRDLEEQAVAVAGTTVVEQQVVLPIGAQVVAVVPTTSEQTK